MMLSGGFPALRSKARHFACFISNSGGVNPTLVLPRLQHSFSFFSFPSAIAKIMISRSCQGKTAPSQTRHPHLNPNKILFFADTGSKIA
jgi:hypothetical protein